jgi:hypothetical protein
VCSQVKRTVLNSSLYEVLFWHSAYLREGALMMFLTVQLKCAACATASHCTNAADEEAQGLSAAFQAL